MASAGMHEANIHGKTRKQMRNLAEIGKHPWQQPELKKTGSKKEEWANRSDKDKLQWKEEAKEVGRICCPS
jgi:hypothetical protein